MTTETVFRNACKEDVTLILQFIRELAEYEKMSAEVVADEKIGRMVADRISEDEITVFDSAGIALQDLASAAQILEIAEKNNIGVVVEL